MAEDGATSQILIVIPAPAACSAILSTAFERLDDINGVIYKMDCFIPGLDGAPIACSTAFVILVRLGVALTSSGLSELKTAVHSAGVSNLVALTPAFVTNVTESPFPR